MKKLDLIGQKFNRLTCISEPKVIKQKTCFIFKCDCGNEVEICGAAVKNGNTKSCGCYQKEMAKKSNTTHTKTHTNEYYSWTNMKTRCCNKNSQDYYNYGGRGIKVCDRWLNSFKNFYEDMGKKPSSIHSLDRINVDGNYCKENCRWATIIEQARNKKKCIIYTTKNGLSMILQDWANYFGIHQANLSHSIKTKSIDELYEYYKVKYNGVFPDGTKREYKKTENYNSKIQMIAYKQDLSIVIEAESKRKMSKSLNIHHEIISIHLKNKTEYKGWRFDYL